MFSSSNELASRQPSHRHLGCSIVGPQNDSGLQLKSFRIDNGLEAHIQLPKTYQAFPGIMNGGAMGGLFDCHGNWTAAIALMDHSSLPKPPLTLTTEVLVRPIALHSFCAVSVSVCVSVSVSLSMSASVSVSMSVCVSASVFVSAAASAYVSASVSSSSCVHLYQGSVLTHTWHYVDL